MPKFVPILDTSEARWRYRTYPLYSADLRTITLLRVPTFLHTYRKRVRLRIGLAGNLKLKTRINLPL